MGIDRPHVWWPAAPGTAGHPALLLLHGTGGDEHSLIHLHKELAPDAAMLSVRGTVSENGMNRFFRRLAEGVLDEEDLRRQVDALAELLVRTEREHGIPDAGWVPVGFSNGANVATALTLLHPERVAGAVAIAAMPPFTSLPDTVRAYGRRVLVINGEHDQLVTETMTTALIAQLEEAAAVPTLVRHPGQHEVPESLLPRIAEFIGSLG